jgi:hypothetical protein
MGARSLGMGNASACIKDEWSLLNNPAGLSELKDATASFSYNAYPHLNAFNRMAAVFTQPFKFGVGGVGVYRFGDKLYNEHVISTGFANQFGLASIGVKFNYIQYQAEGFGSTGVVTVSMGGIATLTPQLKVGANITNINQPEITTGDQVESVPTRLSVALAFQPYDKLLLCTELEKDLAKETLWKTGIEYQFHEKFVARTGFNLNPNAGFVGFGCKPKKFTLNYAMQYSLNVGLNHQATVSYKFSQK